MVYLFIQTIIPTVPASFLTFASSPLYHFYTTVPRVFGISAVDDTRISGLIMKLGMGIVLWSIIAVLFFRWSSKEERPEEPDVLEWQAVERELNRTESNNP
jgi:putative membrane protein